MHITRGLDSSIPVIAWLTLMIPEVDPSAVRPRQANADGIAERIVHNPQKVVRYAAVVDIPAALEREVTLVSKAADVLYTRIRGVTVGSWAREPEATADVSTIALDEELPVVVR